MKIFAVNTIVHREHLPVAFSVGDELPEWAEGLVGDHCLEADSAESATAPDGHPSDAGTSTDEAAAEADDSAEADSAESATVDFTKPARRAPAKRGG